jgi:putative ABC transport system permease protein
VTGLFRRSLADQAGRLVALGLIVAVLAVAAAGLPRAAEDLYSATLHSQVDGASPAGKDLIATVDATRSDNTYDPQAFSVASTWNAIGRNLSATRSSMPTAVRDVTTSGRYVGVGLPTSSSLSNIPGFAVPSSPGAPAGQEFLTIEAYPQLRQDATLVAGRWPSAPTSRAAAIPVAISASAASTLHWRIGQTKALPTAQDATQRLELVGTVRPRSTGSDFWQLSDSRTKAFPKPTHDGEMQFGATVWVDAGAWTSLAPRLAGDQIVAWYPVSGRNLTLPAVGALQDGLTTLLANPAVIHDGTGDGKVLQLASGLPGILQAYQGTARVTSAIIGAALVAVLGVGALVLLATVRLVVGERRRVRDLMRSRGASVLRLVGQAAGDLAAAAIPGAVIGVAAAVVLGGTAPGVPPVGVREVLVVLACAAAPVLCGAAFVGFGEGLSSSVRTPFRRNLWAGEVLLVVLAAAAVAVAASGASRSDPGSTQAGGVDPFVLATPLLVGLAVAVLLLRVYPLFLRAVGGPLRGAGRASSFVGLRDVARGGGTSWIIVASLTATATAAATVVLLSSVVRVQAAAKGPGAPLLAPGTVPLVAGAVLVCVLAAASAFAVSTVADAGRRRARVGTLFALGFARGAAARVALWDAVPAAIVSVVIGGVVGVASASPVLGAVVAGAGQGDGIAVHAAGAVPTGAATAAVVFVMTLVIEFVAVAMDVRGPGRDDRRTP